MGIARLSLELPSDSSSADAVEWAAARLREQGIRGWSQLELQTTLTTGVAGVSKFTFTYWLSSVAEGET